MPAPPLRPNVEYNVTDVAGYLALLAAKHGAWVRDVDFKGRSSLEIHADTGQQFEIIVREKNAWTPDGAGYRKTGGTP